MELDRPYIYIQGGTYSILVARTFYYGTSCPIPFSFGIPEQDRDEPMRFLYLCPALAAIQLATFLPAPRAYHPSTPVPYTNRTMPIVTVIDPTT